jgi:hypothetical protein
MVIDRVDRAIIYLHFLFECAGEKAIHILHIAYYYYTDTLRIYDGNVAHAGLVTPRRRLIWDDVLFATANGGGVCYLIAVYETSVGGTMKTFTARYTFSLHSGTGKNATVAAIYHEETEDNSDASATRAEQH